VVNFVLTGSGTTVFNSKIAGPISIASSPMTSTALWSRRRSSRRGASPDRGRSAETSPAASANTTTCQSSSVRARPAGPPRAAHLRGGVGLARQRLPPGRPPRRPCSGCWLVMIYTIFYYRALGIVVWLGLVSTGALLYAIISFLRSQSGLTLEPVRDHRPVVSVGITVRLLCRVLRAIKGTKCAPAGRSGSSVDRGFRSAYRTILSADAVSFIGAAVLWILSIGAVRALPSCSAVDVARRHHGLRLHPASRDPPRAEPHLHRGAGTRSGSGPRGASSGAL